MNINPWSALCSRWMTQWLSHINSSETSHFRGVTEPCHVPRYNTVTQPAAGIILWWCVVIENGSSSPVFPAQDFWHFDIISTENSFCTTQPKSVENSLCSTVRSNHWTVNAFTRWIILKSSNQILVPNVPCWLGHIGKRKFIIFSIYNSENCPREMFLRGEVFRDGLFMKVEYKRNPLWLRWTGASTQPFEGLLRKLLWITRPLIKLQENWVPLRRCRGRGPRRISLSNIVAFLSISGLTSGPRCDIKDAAAWVTAQQR